MSRLGWILFLSGLFFLAICFGRTPKDWTLDMEAWATEQVLFGGSRTKPSTTVVGYQPLDEGATGVGAWFTTDATTDGTGKCTVTTDGTVKNLRILLDVSPGSGTSYTFTVRKNGSNASLACSIADTATSCQDSTNSFSVTGGDLLTIESSPSGTPASVLVKWTTVFDSTTNQESLMSGGSGGTGTGGTPTTYIQPNHHFLNSDEVDTQELIPIAGTIKNLYFRSSCNVINPWIITLRVNGTSTTLTCTVTSLTCSDTANSVSVAVGDLISLELDRDAGCSPTLNYGMTFVSDSSLNPYMGVLSDLPGTDPIYHVFPPSLEAPSGVSDESLVQVLGQTTSIGVIRARVNSAPSGVCTFYTFTTRINGVDTTNACTISTGETSCVSTTQVNIANDDLLSVEVTDGTCLAIANPTQVSFGIGTISDDWGWTHRP